MAQTSGLLPLYTRAPNVETLGYCRPSLRDEERQILAALDFKVCCIADFQIGRRRKWFTAAGLETRDTADLEICATTLSLTVYSSAGID